MRCIYFFFLFVLIVLSAGCRKFVEIVPPVTEIASATVYANNGSATAVMTGLYENMIAYGNGISGGNYSLSEMEGLASDELVNYSSDPLLSGSYANSLNSISPPGFWFDIYSNIHTANVVLEGVAASKAITAPVKQQLTGEAKFIRALLHFYAVNLFGDVPLATSSNYLVNNSIYKTSQDLVYQQIISDLKDAQSDLSDNYLGGNNASTNERIRPNKGAASALLARAYLYTGKWDSAEIEATNVISNAGMYNLINDPDSVFLANSQEAIWQLQPVNVSFNTWDGYLFILTAPPGSGRYSVAMSPYLLSAFETGDLRYKDWVDSLTDSTSHKVYYYPYKYKVGYVAGSTTLTEYHMVLRLSEQYLIRAEARAQQQKIPEALADLNMIRARAKLLPSTASNGPDLLAAIYHERQVELFTEWGHRWFDLKRTGEIDAVLGSPGGVCASKGGSWSPFRQLQPIPESDILINPHLTQNDGY